MWWIPSLLNNKIAKNIIMVNVEVDVVGSAILVRFSQQT